ncbi:unnamed protein product [Closterium sp. NIES-64]|nr:unnamed protein product [Closterium sp. NIES-64]
MPPVQAGRVQQQLRAVERELNALGDALMALKGGESGGADTGKGASGRGIGRGRGRGLGRGSGAGGAAKGKSAKVTGFGISDSSSGQAARDEDEMREKKEKIKDTSKDEGDGAGEEKKGADIATIVEGDRDRVALKISGSQADGTARSLNLQATGTGKISQADSTARNLQLALTEERVKSLLKLRRQLQAQLGEAQMGEARLGEAGPGGRLAGGGEGEGRGGRGGKGEGRGRVLDGGREGGRVVGKGKGKGKAQIGGEWRSGESGRGEGEGARVDEGKRKGKGKGKVEATMLMDDVDDFDSALDGAAATGFVETERDRLIRLGLITPFAQLKGFDKAVQMVEVGVDGVEGGGGEGKMESWDADVDDSDVDADDADMDADDADVDADDDDGDVVDDDVDTDVDSDDVILEGGLRIPAPSGLARGNSLVITTYEQVRLRRELFLAVDWGYAILDEGHRIRNPDADTTIACKQLRTPHRLLLSGSPIQNRLDELWSLMDFVYPGRLGTLPVFSTEFALPIVIGGYLNAQHPPLSPSPLLPPQRPFTEVRLGTLPVFSTEFALPIAIGGYLNATPLQVATAYKCAVVLRDVILPYLLRRVKADVDIQLPEKTERVLLVPITRFQRTLYRAFLQSEEMRQILERYRNSLYGIDVLRKICNHPDLLALDVDEREVLGGAGGGAGGGEGGGASKEEEDREGVKEEGEVEGGRRRRERRRGERERGRRGEGDCEGVIGSEGGGVRKGVRDVVVDPREGGQWAKWRAAVVEEEGGEGSRGGNSRKGDPDFGNPDRSSKLQVLDKILHVWKAEGHRALVFCQTQQMLDIVESLVLNCNFGYRRMDGSTPPGLRAALIDEFNSGEGGVFVFLLTTRVGGLGTNLTGANRVVIFDPDWNPSTDLQARERAWRIGQKREVIIYRLVTRGTIEEKVFHRQLSKQLLSNRVLRDPKQKRLFKSKDLTDLIRSNGWRQPTGFGWIVKQRRWQHEQKQLSANHSATEPPVTFPNLPGPAGLARLVFQPGGGGGGLVRRAPTLAAGSGVDEGMGEG